MTDPLIYPCLVLLFKLLHEKETNKQQEFYSSHLLLRHYIESKSIFQSKPLFYQNILYFYQEVSNSIKSLQLNSKQPICFQSLENLKDNQRSIFQIIAKMTAIGIQALLNLQIDRNLSNQIIEICQQLHMTLAIEGISISQILLKFIPILTNQIKSLVFYENILNIFNKLDYYQIINSLEKTILKFREQWQKNQQKIPFTISKKNRQSVFLPSPKRNISLQLKLKSNEINEIKENNKSVSKIPEKSKQNIHSNFKKVQPSQKSFASSRRKTFHGNRYQYNGNLKNSNNNSSIENVSFQEKKMQKKQNNHWQDLKYENKFMNLSSQRCGKLLENQSDDVLAGSTPRKKKIDRKK